MQNDLFWARLVLMAEVELRVPDLGTLTFLTVRVRSGCGPGWRDVVDFEGGAAHWSFDAA